MKVDINIYSPAKWLYGKEIGDIYMNPVVKEHKCRLFISRDADAILVDCEDEVVRGVVQVKNSSGYWAIRCAESKNRFADDGLYSTAKIMILTFQDLPEDYFETIEQYGTQNRKSYSIDHTVRRTDNSADNLEWVSVAENKRRRTFGSRNKANVEKIGLNNTRYCARDTKRRKAGIIDRDNKEDYKSIYKDAEDFINEYT